MIAVPSTLKEEVDSCVVEESSYSGFDLLFDWLEFRSVSDQWIVRNDTRVGSGDVRAL